MSENKGLGWSWSSYHANNYLLSEISPTYPLQISIFTFIQQPSSHDMCMARGQFTVVVFGSSSTVYV